AGHHALRGELGGEPFAGLHDDLAGGRQHDRPRDGLEGGGGGGDAARLDAHAGAVGGLEEAGPGDGEGKRVGRDPVGRDAGQRHVSERAGRASHASGEGERQERQEGEEAGARHRKPPRVYVRPAPRLRSLPRPLPATTTSVKARRPPTMSVLMPASTCMLSMAPLRGSPGNETPSPAPRYVPRNVRPASRMT